MQTDFSVDLNAVIFSHKCKHSLATAATANQIKSNSLFCMAASMLD